MTTKQAAKLLGAKGGKIGGKARSPRKTRAILQNLKAARAARWPKPTEVAVK